MIWASIMASCVCIVSVLSMMIGLIRYTQCVKHERESWRTERAELLNRIMARSLPDYTSATTQGQHKSDTTSAHDKILHDWRRTGD